MASKLRPLGAGTLLLALLASCSGTGDGGVGPTPTASAPSIALAPDSVAFAATRGGAAPAAQSVAITNGGGGTLSGLTVGTVTYSAGASGWLSGSLDRGTAPATLTLNAAADSLAVGTYTATITVGAAGAANSPRQVRVRLVVTEPSRIGVTPERLEFSASAGGASPVAQTVAVANAQPGELAGLAVGTITYSSGASGWLAATLDRTIAPATLTVTPTTSSLVPGTYTATIPLTSTTAGVAPQNVPVQLIVSAQPRIGVNPAALAFSASVGGASPAAATVAVTNAGTGTLDGLSVGSITYGAGVNGWLAASLNRAVAPAVLTVTATTGALSAGTYTATIPLASSVQGVAPQNLTVQFTVTTPASIGLSSSQISFTAAEGGVAPSDQAVAVTNAGGGTLGGLAVGSVTYSAGGSAWLSATLDRTTAPASLRLAASVGTLTAGSYEATVSISATGATNSPQSLTVRLTVTAPVGVRAISAGTTHACGIGASGIASCWGSNQFGQVGDGTLVTPRLTPVPVQGLTGVSLVNIAAGDNASCGVAATGTAFCWGNNSFGQLGDGTTTPRLSAVAVASAGGVSFSRVTVGFDHACAVARSGEVFCWGANARGQLGNGGAAASTTPSRITMPAGESFVDVSAGYYFTCGLTSRGAVFCWGANDVAQLGDETFQDRRVPVALRVPAGVVFRNIDAGSRYACGAVVDAAPICWGLNSFGTLGNGIQENDAFNPGAVIVNVPIEQATAGGGVSLGRSRTGEVFNWGAELRTIFVVNNAVFSTGYAFALSVVLPPDLRFSQLSAGNLYACGRSTTGVAYCWGFGAIGDGTTAVRNSPVPISLP